MVWTDYVTCVKKEDEEEEAVKERIMESFMLGRWRECISKSTGHYLLTRCYYCTTEYRVMFDFLLLFVSIAMAVYTRV